MDYLLVVFVLCELSGGRELGLEERACSECIIENGEILLKWRVSLVCVFVRSHWAHANAINQNFNFLHNPSRIYRRKKRQRAERRFYVSYALKWNMRMLNCIALSSFHISFSCALMIRGKYIDSFRMEISPSGRFDGVLMLWIVFWCRENECFGEIFEIVEEIKLGILSISLILF